MKKLVEMLSLELGEAFESAGYDSKYGKVTLSNRPDLCEYQCNGAMAAAKEYHKAPFMIADDVVANLKGSTLISEVESVKPGFINMKLDTEALATYMNEMSADESLGYEKMKIQRQSSLITAEPMLQNLSM